MAQPVWITPSGSLGTIPEGVFFQLPLQAYDPDDPDNPSAIYYTMLAGSLPEGVQCTRTGLIEGIPRAVSSLQGVPAEVAQNVTSKFTVRVYTERIVNGVEVIDRVADRTYSLTVTGQDVPEFVTPSGRIATIFDGVPVEIPIEFTDPDPDDNIRVRIAAGQLPPGLSIDNTGLISGWVIPEQDINEPAGYDLTPIFSYPYDFLVRAISKAYEFTVEITDGKDINLRTFNIFVYARDSMTADTTVYTGDNTFLTGDLSPLRTPFITTPTGSIGTYRHDNFFAFKFEAVDPDGADYEFTLTVGEDIGFDADGTTFDETGIGFDRGNLELPPGLSLDPETGYLYGYIPDIGVVERSYTFAVRVRKTGAPTVISDFYYYTMTLIGAVDTDVVWVTDSDLGTIANGSTSILNIEAYNVGGRALQYRLDPDAPGRLPNGLRLLSDGNVAGRCTFNIFSLDQGLTTFDKDLRTRLNINETTFDSQFTFRVNAYSVDGFVSVFKNFTVTVNKEYLAPYQNLYIQAMPTRSDRALIDSLLLNQDLLNPSIIYRINDPNFGVSDKIRYYHAFGLRPVQLEEYVVAMELNHYRKRLTLGEIQVAQALDDNDEVIYEVVYSRVIDNLVNNDGISVGKQVTLPYPINAGDSTEITTVYPNSLFNMQDQIIDDIGQVASILPRWMTSKQADGRVLGFTPAWVIAYVNPGQGERVAYDIREQFGEQLNLIDFDVDRYELDRQLSINWDPVLDSTNDYSSLSGGWVPTPAATTFDEATTIFDQDSTRFISPVDGFIEDTDQYNKYLLFPKQNILG